MEKKLTWIFLILMWVSLIASLIVKEFSNIGYWILFGCWAVFCIANLVYLGFWWRDIKKQEKELEQKFEEDKKRLEQLIKGYLTISLSNEIENKGGKEG